VASGSYTDQGGPGYFLARVRPKSSWAVRTRISYSALSHRSHTRLHCRVYRSSCYARRAPNPQICVEILYPQDADDCALELMLLHLHKNQSTAIKSIVTILKEFKPPDVAILKQVDTIHLAYHGNVTQERHALSSVPVHSLISRMTAPGFWIHFSPSCEVIYGIWLSYDHDQNVPLGSILLSCASLTNGEPLQERASRRRPQHRVVNRRYQ